MASATTSSADPFLADVESLKALASQAIVRRGERPVATVSAVLAEVVRGRPADAAVFSGLRGHRVQVRVVDTRVGVRAGQLLGGIGAGSDLAIDAFLVAAGDLEGGAVVATSDVDDLTLLASPTPSVLVADIRG